MRAAALSAHWSIAVADPRPSYGCPTPEEGRIRSGSPEREWESLHSRAKKLDFELAIGDRLRLPDQLVETLFGPRTVALGVDVEPVGRAWRLSIDQHAKTHGRPWRCRAHDEMQIAGVKAVRDASIGLVHDGGILPH